MSAATTPIAAEHLVGVAVGTGSSSKKKRKESQLSKYVKAVSTSTMTNCPNYGERGGDHQRERSTTGGARGTGEHQLTFGSQEDLLEEREMTLMTQATQVVNNTLDSHLVLQ